MYASYSKIPVTGIRNRGFVLPTAAVMFMLGVPIAGLSIDLGVLYLVQGKLQAAVDAGALAGARSLARGNNSSQQQANAQNTAIQFINANFPSGYMGTSSLTIPTPTVDVTQPNIRSVAVSASVNVPHLFLRWFGGILSSVNAGATATRRDVNVAIVMDRSGSLANSGSCTALKAAAQAFVDKFAEGRDNVGLITFATSSREDFPIANNFKTASPTVSGIIGNVTCTGGTNSAQGLWQGYQQLTRLQQPTALNVILFFTDGQPTAITGNFPIKASSTCSQHTPIRGVFSAGGSPASVIGGLFNDVAPPQPMASDLNLAPNSTNCSYASGWWGTYTNAGNDITDVPTVDAWGNNLNTGYQPVTLTSGNIAATSNSTNALNFVNAATNAADNAGQRIRAQASPGNGYPALPGVVVFSIGLGISGGTAAAPHDFMRRVANDPASSSYNAAAPTGTYVYAPTTADLASAFNQVASEILRLAK